MNSLFDHEISLPSFVYEGPFLSIFVVHKIKDIEAYKKYQKISDNECLKPSSFGGEVLGFSKPVFRFIGPEEAVALAVIKWPNFDCFKKWRTQEKYSRQLLKKPGKS